MVFAIELSQFGKEAGGDTVLVVELDSTGDGSVSNNVAVSQVFCDDARAWLLLLCDVVAVAVGIGCRNAVVAGRLVGGQACSRGYGDVRSAELGVVEEQGGFGSGVLLKGHSGGLSVAVGLDVEAGDLAAVVTG